MAEKSDPALTSVRRALLEMRRMWRDHAPVSPFSLAAPLPGDTHVSRFAYLFVSSSHTRRKASD